MLELAEKIGLSDALREKLHILYEKDEADIISVADRCMTDSFSILRKKSFLFRLAVILLLALRIKKRYDEEGIAEKIYYDTMSDIKIWCDKNGDEGLKNFGWLQNHVKFELFRIGRLQFQLYECKNPTLNYKKLPFVYGEKLVYIHIPEGEKLENEKCVSSINQANEFFGKHFPDYKYNFYFCESWLLFENNRDFMSEHSNIVSFMSLFDVCYSIKIDKQAIERIFGKRRFLIKKYPENTELQKRAKAYMKSGRRMGIGVGIISKEETVKNFEN